MPGTLPEKQNLRPSQVSLCIFARILIILFRSRLCLSHTLVVGGVHFGKDGVHTADESGSLGGGACHTLHECHRHHIVVKGIHFGAECCSGGCTRACECCKVPARVGQAFPECYKMFFRGPSVISEGGQTLFQSRESISEVLRSAFPTSLYHFYIFTN